MTPHSIQTVPTNSPAPTPTATVPSATTPPRPAWWNAARTAIARLRQYEADSAGTRYSPFDLDDDAGATIPASPDAPKPSVLDLLSESPGLTDLPDDLAEAVQADGGDPFAISATGAEAPDIRLPASQLLTVIRLAATFGTEGLMDLHRPGAVTVLRDVPPEDADLLRGMLAHLLPAGWQVKDPLRNARVGPNTLVFIDPTLSHGRFSDAATSELHRKLFAALDAAAPTLIILPPGVELPPSLLPRALDQRRLPPIGTDILIAALCASHSATRRIDEAAVRAALCPQMLL